MPPWGAAGIEPAAAAACGPKRAAIIGSGPAGLACAGELARHGVAVTIFEALHVAGGVLKYGIPEFRLPDMIIDAEIENLKKMGVEIRLDTIIGKLFTIPQLLGEMGYHTAFVGTGAGSPKFAGIPGEAFNGVFSANEFLTRVNLMRGLPAADLRYAGGHGQARGRGGRGQYRDGLGARGACAWARNR